MKTAVKIPLGMQRAMVWRAEWSCVDRDGGSARPDPTVPSFPYQIMRLLYRFYDVKDGSIKINGVDLREATQKSIRKAIGLVPQDPVLFNESVRYNIACVLALHTSVVAFH
jgi:energy-coupling factor transporter ATP-binding protein EcfA2